MKCVNEMTIVFESRSANEGFARAAAAAFFLPLDPTVEELSDLKTALSEAVTNAIVHGYPHQIGKIKITARILEGSVAYIKVRDYGTGIPDIQKAMEPLFTTGDSSERSGLGFTVMQSFTDRVKVTSKPGKGTSVTLIKTLSGRDGHETDEKGK